MLAAVIIGAYVIIGASYLSQVMPSTFRLVGGQFEVL